jgi:hypothetical protein
LLQDGEAEKHRIVPFAEENAARGGVSVDDHRSPAGRYPPPISATATTLPTGRSRSDGDDRGLSW